MRSIAPDNKKSAQYELEELRDLIKNMTSNSDSTMILVDGLYVCGHSTSLVVELLAGLNADEDNSDVKTLFLSRDEHHIRDWLDDYSQISIAARGNDLKLYVGAEIENRTRLRKLRLKDQTLKEAIMERLMEKADGMYVPTQDLMRRPPTLSTYHFSCIIPIVY